MGFSLFIFSTYFSLFLIYSFLSHTYSVIFSIIISLHNSHLLFHIFDLSIFSVPSMEGGGGYVNFYFIPKSTSRNISKFHRRGGRGHQANFRFTPRYFSLYYFFIFSAYLFVFSTYFSIFPAHFFITKKKSPLRRGKKNMFHVHR